MISQTKKKHDEDRTTTLPQMDKTCRNTRLSPTLTRHYNRGGKEGDDPSACKAHVEKSKDNQIPPNRQQGEVIARSQRSHQQQLPIKRILDYHPRSPHVIPLRRNTTQEGCCRPNGTKGFHLVDGDDDIPTRKSSIFRNFSF